MTQVAMDHATLEEGFVIDPVNRSAGWRRPVHRPGRDEHLT